MKTRTAKLNSLVFESVLVTLIVLAFQKGSQDPLHPVKLFILGILAVWILSTFIASKKAFLILRNRYPLNLYASILFIFIFFLLISTFKTSVISIGILGDTGRNMGFLNYLFLSIVALFYALRFDITNAKSFYIIFFVLATVLSIYGFFQHYHMDFLRWQTKGNPVILTVGNPDFASSLLAIVGTVTIAGLFIETFGKYRFFLVIPAVSTGFTIYFTQAIQGLVIYAISVTFLTTLYIYQKNQTVGRILFLFDFCGLLFSFFGTLKIGPFSSYFYKSSIADRGYDWRAAISMLKKHPIFGVGLDRYGYYFPELKDKIYPIRFGYETTVNNAHNVFLQFFATAGIFVGITYLTLTMFVAWRAF